MEEGKFKELIKDVYKKSKEGNLSGVLYGAVSTCGLSDITNIDDFVNVCNPDMLHLKSILSEEEIDIYSWELEFYKVKEHTIYIKLKSRPEKPIMY